jgi:hypothetical protein
MTDYCTNKQTNKQTVISHKLATIVFQEHIFSISELGYIFACYWPAQTDAGLVP